MSTQIKNDSAEEIWKLFREIAKQAKETDARLNKQIAETDALNKLFAETDARLNKLFAETEKQFKETDKKINKVHGLFTSQWGRLIEAMVEPNAINLFKERGIEVEYIHRRSKCKLKGRTMELDLLLENGNEVVIVEAKSTLRVSNVRDFLEKLGQFLEFFPRFHDYRIYGAVAGMDIVEEADIYADRQGLFVLNAAGDGIAHIKNEKKFAPKDFGRAEIR